MKQESVLGRIEPRTFHSCGLYATKKPKTTPRPRQPRNIIRHENYQRDLQRKILKWLSEKVMLNQPRVTGSIPLGASHRSPTAVANILFIDKEMSPKNPLFSGYNKLLQDENFHWPVFELRIYVVIACCLSRPI